MRYAVDSSSVINLFNAGALALVCQLERCRICLPPLVVGECEPSCAAAILELKESGSLSFIDDADVDAELFLKLLDDYHLGDGETECIAVAAVAEYRVCSDDKKAREAATEVLGNGQVIGTLRLLRWCVEEDLLPCEEAYAIFKEMRRKGGFLPSTDRDFFCEGD